MSRYVNDETNELGEWIISKGTMLDVATLTPYEVTSLSVLIVGVFGILLTLVLK